jgi:hypothetical protein
MDGEILCFICPECHAYIKYCTYGYLTECIHFNEQRRSSEHDNSEGHSGKEIA